MLVGLVSLDALDALDALENLENLEGLEGLDISSYVVVEVLEGNEGLDFGLDDGAAESLLHKCGYRYCIHTGNSQITAKFRIGSYLRRVEIQRVDEKRIRLGYDFLFSHIIS